MAINIVDDLSVVKGIIFDLDNTLIDTRGGDRKALRKAALGWAFRDRMAASPDKFAMTCIYQLNNSKTNNDKINALLFTIETIKSPKSCSPQVLRQLFVAIEFEFIKDILLSTDLPADCPPYMLKSVAASLLSCFCNDSELVRNKQMVDLGALLSKILNDLGDSSQEDAIKNDILQCLTCLAAIPENREQLVMSGTLKNVTLAFLDQRTDIDDNIFLDVIVRILSCDCAGAAWQSEPDLVNRLLDNVCFSPLFQKKFEVFSKVAIFIRSYPDSLVSSVNETKWLAQLRKGLKKVMFSKLPTDLRKQLLVLASYLIDKFGCNWLQHNGKEYEKLFFLIVSLISIEVRVALDGMSLAGISDVEGLFLTCCYSTIENVIQLLVSESLSVEPDQFLQLHGSLTAAANSIACFLAETANSFSDCTSIKSFISTKPQTYVFLLSTIRVFSVWLAEETDACREEVVMALPFLLKCANCECEMTSYTVLECLLPALCSLSSDVTTRKVLLANGCLEMLKCFAENQWCIFNADKSNGNQKIVAAKLVPVFAIISNFRESELVKSCDLIAEVFEFACVALQIVKMAEFVSLFGQLVVFALLVLKGNPTQLGNTDLLDAASQFFQGAFDCGGGTFVITESYEVGWVSHLSDLWLLGMKTMSQVCSENPCVVDYISDSGWPKAVVKSLCNADGEFQREVLEAFQVFLCSLIKFRPEVKFVLKQNSDILCCCKRLKLDDLFNLLMI